MEHDASDRPRVVETQIAPGLAGVGRAIDAAAPRRALPIVVLAGARPDDARVGLEDRERSERVVRLLGEDVLPRDALVRRLPDAAGCGADIQNRRVLGVNLQIVDASARRRRTDVAEVQRVKWRAHGLDVGMRAEHHENAEDDQHEPDGRSDTAANESHRLPGAFLASIVRTGVDAGPADSAG